MANTGAKSRVVEKSGPLVEDPVHGVRDTAAQWPLVHILDPGEEPSDPVHGVSGLLRQHGDRLPRCANDHSLTSFRIFGGAPWKYPNRAETIATRPSTIPPFRR